MTPTVQTMGKQLQVKKMTPAIHVDKAHPTDNKLEADFASKSPTLSIFGRFSLFSVSIFDYIADLFKSR